MEEKLDTFLRVLAKKGLFVGIDTTTLVGGFREKNYPELKLSNEEFVMVLDILNEDKMIEERTENIMGTVFGKTLVYITTKGMLKILKGGYSEDVRILNEKKRQEKILYYAQIFVIVAGVYYTLEIFKILSEFFCCE